MSRELFGTDGVRGMAGEYPLDEAGATAIGLAVGTHFAKPGEQVVIGCDPRESSEGLVKAVAAGLNRAGADVVLAGVLPTPGLAYLTGNHDEFVAGVMITASHNPYRYNGIKVFDRGGGKLSDDTEVILNKLIKEGAVERSTGSTSDNKQLATEYEAFLVNSAAGTRFDGLTLGVDTANGAASGLAARVFVTLGAATTPLFETPNGRNINDGCGANDTTALKREVMNQGLQAGAAVDGDADRLSLVDGQGRELNGDHLLYILAVTGGLKGVVGTSMTNLGLERALQAKGITLERADVGDRYVLEDLERTGYELGGEQSGHIIMPQLLPTGDGLLAAIQTLKAVQASGKILADWRDELVLLPQALVNVALKDPTVLQQAPIQDFIKAQTADLGSEGRLLIRPSGTEPLVRVMVESIDAEDRAQNIANKLKELLT